MEKTSYPSLDSLPLAVFFLDRDLRFSYVNRAFSELAGSPAGTWAGRTFIELLPPGEWPAAAEKLDALGTSGNREVSFEIRIRRENGALALLEGRVARVEEGAESAAYSGGLLDISGRKAIEEKEGRLLRALASANQEMKEFTSIVSHDLKAPLRSISSLAGWIRDDFADRLGADGRENLDLLVDRVRRMYAMVEGIVRFSRITGLREERTAVDVESLVVETLNRLSLPDGVRIVKETPFPVVSCERTRLGTVFSNLLDNALKALDGKEGEIRIGACPEGDCWRFWVKDNGKGIPKEQQERIFKLFQKVCQEDGGTGIGLTLARKIVEADGGEIKVDSAPGEGAVFSFTLRSADDVPVPA